jgi:hypothetical protein
MMHLSCWTTSCVEGELLMGDTLVRHGRRPFLWQTETAITLRLDADVVAATARRLRPTHGLRRVHKPNVRSTTSRSF